MRGQALLLLSLAAGCAPRADVEVDRRAGVEAAGRLWIDTRLPAEFAAGHRPGALNLQWDWDQLSERVRAYVPERATPITLRATTPGEAARAAAALLELGYEDVERAPAEVEGETQRLPLLTAAELRERLHGERAPTVIDVRSAAEFATGTIPGALLVDQDEAAALVVELDRARTYAVICEGGYRSSQLASWMRSHGFEHASNVIDGMAAWRALR